MFGFIEDFVLLHSSMRIKENWYYFVFRFFPISNLLVVKFLPSDVNLLCPAIQAFLSLDASQSCWMQRVGIIAILHNLVQIPFPLVNFLSNAQISAVVARLEQLLKANCKEQQLAAMILAKICARNDMLELSHSLLSGMPCDSVWMAQGYLYFLYYFLKFAGSNCFSQDYVDLGQKFFDMYGEQNFLIRRYWIKILSKMSTFGSRQLLFVKLIHAFSDGSSSNRWTAAKGLCCLYHDEEAYISQYDGDNGLLSSIVTAAHGLFVDNLQKFASGYVPEIGLAQIHSSILFFSEMIRKNLLDTVFVESYLIEGLLEALCMDKMVGLVPVGSLIRDASCYMAWCIARNSLIFSSPVSDTSVLKCQSLAVNLVILATSDRLVTCRRAAALSLQELIGRKRGVFEIPFGYEILSSVTYFSVCSLSTCFTELLPQLLSFYPYSKPLLNHLICKSLISYDSAIRKYSIDLLRKLYEANFTFSTRVDKFTLFAFFDRAVQLISNPQLLMCELHGLISFIGLFLSGDCSQKFTAAYRTCLSIISDRIIVPLLDDLRSGHYSRIHIEILIVWQSSTISAFGFQYANRVQIEELWIKFLRVSYNSSSRQLLNHQDDLQYRFTSTVIQAFYSSPVIPLCDKIQLFKTLENFLSDTCMDQTHKRGLILAMYDSDHSANLAGTFLLKLYEDHKKPSEYFIREAIIIKLGELIYLSKGDRICCANFADVLPTLLKGLDDYCFTHQGDVGSFVRCASINSLAKFVSIRPLVDWDASSRNILTGRLLRISCERIDVLSSISFDLAKFLGLVDKASYSTFNDANDKTCKVVLEGCWDSFDEKVQRQILRAFIYSIGGPSESHSKIFLSALLEFLDQKGKFTEFWEQSQVLFSFWIKTNGSSISHTLVHSYFKTCARILENLKCSVKVPVLQLLQNLDLWLYQGKGPTTAKLETGMELSLLLLSHDFLSAFSWFQNFYFKALHHSCPRLRALAIEQLYGNILVTLPSAEILHQQLLEISDASPLQEISSVFTNILSCI